MENVSHNTSFDSNDNGEDDDLSRTAIQPNLLQERTQAAEWSAHQQNEQEAFYGQQQLQMSHERAQFLNRQGSEAETEQNAYGFAAHQANPSNQIQQAIWQDFQKAQHQDSADARQSISRIQALSPDDIASDVLSRPTAAFDNQCGGSNALNYPEEIQAEEDEDEELEVQLKNRHLHLRGESNDRSLGLYRNEEGRIIDTEEALRQQQNFLYQNQFVKRFHPDSQMDSELLRSHEPHSRIASAGPVQNLLSGTLYNQSESRSKKRSRADFLNQESGTSENQLQRQGTMHSQQSSASKESILQSLKKQQTRHQVKPPPSQGTFNENLGDLTSQHVMMTEFTLSQPRTREHSNKQVPDQSQLVTSKEQTSELDFDPEPQVQAQRDSFPLSGNGAGDEDEQNEEVDDSNMRAKVVALLWSRIAASRRLERTQLRSAFDKLALNRQGSLIEQLLQDNEQLMDQIQTLQQQSHLSQASHHAQEPIAPFPSAHDLYNQGTGLTNGRNNDKSDQTHSVFENHGTLKVFQHTNSSNKDSSPQNMQQKDSAFMRAMLRDDTSQYMSPYANTVRPQQASVDDQILPSRLATDPFFEQFSNQLKDVAILSQRHQYGRNSQIDDSDSLIMKLEELNRAFELQSDKIRLQCQQVDQMRDLLSTKVQGVDRLELENLELHMQLDAKLRALETLLKCSNDASKLFKFDHKKSNESECQTRLSYGDIEQKEATLQVFSKELSLVKMRQAEDYESKKHGLDKRECDLEIRERLIEEKRVEYSYKQKELNQRIKSQMTWPLNCLENDTKLLEKFRDFKLKPDHLKNLEADSNLSLFMQREENLQLLQSFSGEMQVKCEGLLHFEYLLLKERAKNMVFHDNTITEMTNLQSESEELARDRERYQISSELERQIQQESSRVEKQHTELIVIQENLLKLVRALGDTFKQLGSSMVALPAPNISPDIQSHKKSNQLNVLLSNLKKSFSPQLDDASISRISPAINPYSQTINAKDPASLLQVVNDYRSTDPMSSYMKSKDMQTLIETAIEHLESSSRLNLSSTAQEQDDRDRQNLRQIRRMLVRDAYFLQKERQWLDQERLKLNSHIARATRRKSQANRTAQVQTSLERGQAPDQQARPTPNTQQVPRSEARSPHDPAGGFERRNQYTMHQSRASEGGSGLVSPPTRSRQRGAGVGGVQNHVPRDSYDSNAAAVNFQLPSYAQPTTHLPPSETSQLGDNLSVISTNLNEQDRKKIQLLQTNLALEKEYNAELQMQLQAQMELIKSQNEKLLEGETHVNQTKLRLLVKLDQIKLLEDFYNQHNNMGVDASQLIHLDMDLDENQLKNIVDQLHSKYHPEVEEQQTQRADWQTQKLLFGETNTYQGTQIDVQSLDQSQSYSERDMSASRQKRNQYFEYWAQEGVASILRHLLMERCRFNPGTHRLQYAFLLFRCATLRPNYDGRKALNGTQQLRELLQESTPTDSRVEESAFKHQKTQAEIVRSIQEEIEVPVRPVKEMVPKPKEEQGEVVVAQGVAFVEIKDDGDWFSVYWAKKRGDYFDDTQEITPKQISIVAKQLEGDIATFWKFRARNTLRLMQLHASRRNRMLYFFAFQRYKVQAMRATLQRVISTRFEVSNNVQILNSSSQSKQDNYYEIQSIGGGSTAAKQSYQRNLTNEMTVSKRHSLLMLLTMRNDQLNAWRHKNRVFSKWRAVARDAQQFTVQLEIARLANEVQKIKRQEESLKMSFMAQKNELESKVTILLGFIAAQ